jgi:phage head maturation protease
MSFGFTVTDDDLAEADYGYLRTIKAIGKLYDVSAVSIPANDYTEISARNHIDGAIDEIETERIRLEEERKALEEKKENLVERLKALKESKDEN